MSGLGFRSGDRPAIVAGHVAGLPGGFRGPRPRPTARDSGIADPVGRPPLNAGEPERRE